MHYADMTHQMSPKRLFLSIMPKGSSLQRRLFVETLCKQNWEAFSGDWLDVDVEVFFNNENGGVRNQRARFEFLKLEENG